MVAGERLELGVDRVHFNRYGWVYGGRAVRACEGSNISSQVLPTDHGHNGKISCWCEKYMYLSAHGCLFPSLI